MKRRWIVLGGIVALLFGASLGVTALLTTQAGLKLALQLAQRATPGALSVDAASGRLIGPLQLEGVSYADATGNYRIAQIVFDWSPGRLLARRLSIHQLHITDADIALAEPQTKADGAPTEPGWALPLEVVVRDLSVSNLRIRTGNAEPVVIESLSAAASSGLEWLDIERLQLAMPQLALGVQGRLGLGRDVATDLVLDWRMTPAGYAPIAAQGRLSGTWEQASLTQQFSAPGSATAQLELRQPFADLQWALQLDMPVTMLTQINAAWPAQQIGGKLQGTGTLKGGELSADLQTDWAAQDLYPLGAELTLATGDDGSLHVQPLVLRQGESLLRLTGSWSTARKQFDANLAAQNFIWPPTGVPRLQLSNAELQIEGALDAYRLSLAAHVAGQDLPESDLQATGQGNREGVRLDNLDVRTLDGVAQAQGRLAWAPQLSWDARLDAQNLNPGRQWPDWPGKLSAQLQSTGSVGDQGLALTARIEQLGGELRGYPVEGTGAASMRDGVAKIETVHLRSGDARLDLDGSIGERWDLAWTLQAADLRQMLPSLSGALDAKGTLSGPRAQPRVQAQAKLQAFSMADVRLTGLDLRTDLSLQPGAALMLEARGNTVRIADRRFDSLAVDLDGKLERHNIELQAQGPVHALHFSAQGGWDGRLWSGRLERGDWQLPEVGAWSLDKPVALQLGAERGAVGDACWQQAAARLCTQLDYSAKERHVQAALSDWPLAQLQRYLTPDVRIQDSTLSADLNMRQSAQDAARGNATLRMSPGSVHWNAAGQPAETTFGGADAALQLDTDGLRGTAQLRLSGSDQLNLQARLPGYRPGVQPDAQRLDGTLRGEIRDFALVNALVENVDDLSGKLSLDTTLAGTLGDPAVRGALQLTDGRGFIGPAGVQLQDWQLMLSGDPTDGRLRLQSTARSGPGTVQLEGWLAHLGSAELAGELHIGGTSFEAVNLPEARVLVTPDLTCAVRAQSVEVSGTLHIPEARIEPRDLSGAVTPSKDVVLVNQEQAPPPGWAVSSRVQVSLGDKVQFNGFGLKGRLTGALDVVDLPNRVPLGRGELAVRDGVYKAYGQELKIEQGRVLYRDSPLDNPALDVRATRKTGDVLAGVRVLGTAKDPVAELYSQPSLSQADTLSYLLLGRPVANASGSEGELLFKAASSLGLKGGNMLAQNIGNAFGLDEVSVGGGDDLESAALKVGKYLSPRLYVNYSVGLLDAANKLQMRYQLSKRLSVQTETGTATGADLLYSIER